MTFIDYNNRGGSVGRNHAPVSTHAPTYFVASWKGLEFFVDTSSDEFGRRGDIYEYPLGDDTGYKDLGRRARRFKLEGYLIGSNQVGQTQNMTWAAESPEPGLLVHPIYGEQRVACITLTVTADYRKDKKRTRLAFEFVEANESWAPFQAGKSLQALFDMANEAIIDANARAGNVWAPNGDDLARAQEISDALAAAIRPPIDEKSNDAIDMLLRQTIQPYYTGDRIVEVAAPRMVQPKAYWRDYAGESFLNWVDPINFGTATIRRIHADSLERLREFNAVLAQQGKLASPSVAAIVITARLMMIRDYAVAASVRVYETVKAALDDLDFIMTVYDEEEEIAARECNDMLVIAIRRARATAVQAILLKNIRLPGIAEFPVDGLWPSLLAAHKLYGDGTRYQQIENYNPTMPPFWMGRTVVTPTR